MRKGQVILLCLIVVSLLSSACSLMQDSYYAPKTLQRFYVGKYYNLENTIENILKKNGFEVNENLSNNKMVSGKKEEFRIDVTFNETLGGFLGFSKGVVIYIYQYKLRSDDHNNYNMVDVAKDAYAIDRDIRTVLKEKKERE